MQSDEPAGAAAENGRAALAPAPALPGPDDAALGKTRSVRYDSIGVFSDVYAMHVRTVTGSCCAPFQAAASSRMSAPPAKHSRPLLPRCAPPLRGLRQPAGLGWPWVWHTEACGHHCRRAARGAGVARVRGRAGEGHRAPRAGVEGTLPP